MCILSGCDYLESIKGIGIKKAFKFIYENGDDIKIVLKKIFNEGRYQVPIDYQNLFEKAMLTFKFQVVYDPLREELVHLNNPETHPLGALLINYPDLNFLGEKIDNEIAKRICKGEIDPITMEEFEKINLDFGSGSNMTIYEIKNDKQFINKKDERRNKMQGVSKDFGINNLVEDCFDRGNDFQDSS